MRGPPGDRFAEVDGDADEEQPGGERPQPLQEINRRESRSELFVHQEHLRNHRGAHGGEGEVNHAQAHADAECDGAQDRAPQEVAFVHLREERKHEKPGRGDCDQETWVS